MSAHPYKAAMLDQLAAQADGIMRLNRELKAARSLAGYALDGWERAAARLPEPPKPSLLARIRAWWPL